MRAKFLFLFLVVAALGVLLSGAATPILSEAAVAKPPVKAKNYLDYQPKTSAAAISIRDVKSGKVLYSLNGDKPWPAASITKLAAMLVYLDTKPSFAKKVSLKSSDEVGGAGLKAVGISLTVKDLFYCSLMQSTNNTVNALVRSTGLTSKQFVARMNRKVKAYGLSNTTFVDPTGIEPANVTTANDLGVIATAAFSNYYIRSAASATSYLFSQKIYGQNKVIKNTDKLLQDSSLDIVGGKTGLLNESKFNFTFIVRGRRSSRVAVTVLGAESWDDLFVEAKAAALWAQKNWVW